MRRLLCSVTLLVLVLFAGGQECSISLKGVVNDKSTGQLLAFANVYIEEASTGAASGFDGEFVIDDLCPGKYHIRISHLGCESKTIYIGLNSDTMLNITLSHHAELLDEVQVHGSKEDGVTQTSNTISKDEIVAESSKDLSEIIDDIVGVSSMKTGSGLSKPIIHGLYGNRVTILNNGIAQAGQQWGNDHAPEIDPFVADHISVIKGASSLAYGGGSLGGVVLVEPAHIKQDPHLHGQVNYQLQSNGWGNTLNMALEKNSKWASWRAIGTMKVFGDQRAPDYYLRNTGKREGNLALQLEKDFNTKWKSDLYFSYFQTEIGVLRGAHIGNLTDLEQAIDREEPFYTEENFSFGISAPKQQVQHYLLKANVKYFSSSDLVLKFTYGGQLNNRKEFDVRRGGLKDVPALSLLQHQHFLEGSIDFDIGNNIFLKSGMQYTYTENDNNPETGIFPLIPDYRLFNPSAFVILQKRHNRFLFEAGGRYDLDVLKVVTFTETLPREVERLDHQFHQYALSGGTKFTASERFNINLDLGLRLRAPEVNELYSFGLHQGVSGIEEGNRNLETERSLKSVLTGNLNVKERLFVQAVGYYQNITDYIFLEPQDELRLTIRGAFPVFIYQQTDAALYGLDLLLKVNPQEQLSIIGKYEFVRGNDLNADLPLIFMPPDQFQGSIQYDFREKKNLGSSFIKLSSSYAFEQTRFQEELDLTVPPDDYFLLGLDAGTEVKLRDSVLKIRFSINNLLNTSYRNYLNRLRYFADEEGIDIGLGINYQF